MSCFCEGVFRTETAKVFTIDGAQAVLLPKGCRFEDQEVMVRQIGDIVLLMPKKGSWASVRTGLSLFTDDFLAEEIEDLPMQERE